MDRKSYLFAIEGTDGSGKGTQYRMLIEKLKKLDQIVQGMDFPNYDSPSSTMAKLYLDGKFGNSGSDVPPFVASTFFAIDRFFTVRDTLKGPADVIITNRYVGSNLAHQGGKISNKEERLKFYQRIQDLEYIDYGIPVPDVNIVLYVDPEKAQENVDQKEKATRSYTDKKRDIHEADINHLNNASYCYKELCEIYPDKYIFVNCMDKNSGKMRTIEDINSEICQIINKKTGLTVT